MRTTALKRALFTSALALALSSTLAPSGALTVASPSGSDYPAARASGPLKVRPAAFLPGQALVFKGSLGKKSGQKVHLQTHLNRRGDTWLDLANSGSRTRAGGAFKIRRPAPGMDGISYRAVSGGRSTSGALLFPRTQEAILQAQSGVAGRSGNNVDSGQPFTIDVDTAPDLPGSRTSMAIVGRTVTLQQRVGRATWQSIGSTEAETSGHAEFAMTAGSVGDVVYRAVLEDYTAGRNEIGEHPSYPTYVHVVDSAGDSGASSSPPAAAGGQARGPNAGANPSAAAKFGWGRARYGFEWELGQSLSSPPSRGTKPRGSWADFSDGTGRAMIRNGALALNSNAANGVDTALGTTWAALDGKASREGRWEARVWVQALKAAGPDVTLKFELVPASSSSECGANTLTVAQVTAHRSRVLVGATGADAARSWTREVNVKAMNQVFFNYAVEVDKKHITWFIDAKPVATTNNKELLSRTKWRPRISMTAPTGATANTTQALVDWVRAFNVEPGRTTASNRSLKPGSITPVC